MTGSGANDGSAAAREMRILADILALTLDEQPGVADAALANIKARAREGGVTAGALKEAWRRIGAPPAPEQAQVPEAALARTRMEIATLQSQVGHAEALRRGDQQRLVLELRQARLVALLGGMMAGAALTAVVYALVA